MPNIIMNITNFQEKTGLFIEYYHNSFFQIHQRRLLFCGRSNGKGFEYKTTAQSKFDFSFELLINIILKVTGIEMKGERILVKGVEGPDSHKKEFAEEFDYVIVAVPLGVLQDGMIQFIPELPESKITAIRGLEVGVVDKVGISSRHCICQLSTAVLQFSKQFWPEDLDFICYSSKKESQWTDFMNITPLTGEIFNGKSTNL